MTGIDRAASARLPTRFGEFAMHAYDVAGAEAPYLVLTRGEIGQGMDVLTRIHSSCLTGDAFGSLKCDCGEQLELSLERIAAEGRGVLIYAQQEGRGIGLVNKVRAYALQDGGADTVEANISLGLAADRRDYAAAALILRDLGVVQVRLMTNNPAKLEALAGHGIAVAQRVPLVTVANGHNRAYLATKARKMGHMLENRKSA